MEVNSKGICSNKIESNCLLGVEKCQDEMTAMFHHKPFGTKLAL